MYVNLYLLYGNPLLCIGPFTTSFLDYMYYTDVLFIQYIICVKNILVKFKLKMK